MIEWEKSLGGSLGDLAYSIQQTLDGGYVVAGWGGSNDGDATGNHGDWDFWIVKLSTTGSIDWQKSLGGSGLDVAWSIQQTSDEGYIVSGTNTSNDGDVSGNHGSNDYWVVKLSDTGALEWEKSLGGSNGDWSFSIQQTSNGGYIVAGDSVSNDGDVTDNHGNWDFWIVKLSTDIGINDNEMGTRLLTLYPNPTKDFFTIQYMSDTKETMQLNIINISGQLVYSKPREVLVGVNQFKYKNELKAGVYIVELRSTSTHITRKLIID